VFYRTINVFVVIMDMQIYFWTDYKLNNFLIYGFDVKTVPGFIAVCFGVAAFAFLLEYMRYIQAVQHQKVLVERSEKLKNVCPAESSDMTLIRNPRASAALVNYKTIIAERCKLIGADVGIWYSLLIMAYLLMLIVMTFNCWFLFAAVIGGGIGYFVFGQMLVKLNLENCKIIQDTFCGTSAQDQSSEGQSTPALERVNSSSPMCAPGCRSLADESRTVNRKLSSTEDCHESTPLGRETPDNYSAVTVHAVCEH